jgi:hypothetical protein
MFEPRLVRIRFEATIRIFSAIVKRIHRRREWERQNRSHTSPHVPA